jgi:hypothetical protein
MMRRNDLNIKRNLSRGKRVTPILELAARQMPQAGDLSSQHVAHDPKVVSHEVMYGALHMRQWSRLIKI